MRQVLRLTNALRTVPANQEFSQFVLDVKKREFLPLFFLSTGAGGLSGSESRSLTVLEAPPFTLEDTEDERFTLDPRLPFTREDTEDALIDFDHAKEWAMGFTVREDPLAQSTINPPHAAGLGRMQRIDIRGKALRDGPGLRFRKIGTFGIVGFYCHTQIYACLDYALLGTARSN